MHEQIVAAVLGVLAALFGGLNIFQLLFLRSTRKRYRAEASSVETEAHHKHVDLMQDQYDFLLVKLDTLQKEFYSLSEKYRKESLQYVQELAEKCREVEHLKDEVKRLQRENASLRADLEGCKAQRAAAAEQSKA